MFTIKVKPRPNEKIKNQNFIDAVEATCALASNELAEKEMTLIYPKHLSLISLPRKPSDISQSKVQEIELPTDSNANTILNKKCSSLKIEDKSSPSGSPMTVSSEKSIANSQGHHSSEEIPKKDETMDVTNVTKDAAKEDSGDLDNPESQLFYDVDGNLLSKVQSEQINEANKSKRSLASTLFKKFPPSKEEFFDAWKKVRNAPEEFGLNPFPLMSQESFEDFYNFYTKTEDFQQTSERSMCVCGDESSHSQTISPRNLGNIRLSDIPQNPIRGYEHFFNWKPVLDAQVLKRQKRQYQAYKAKYPHLPTLTTEDFKFNPATVQRCMRKAEQWDKLVIQQQSDILKKPKIQWTKNSNLGSNKTPALLSKTPFLKLGIYQSTSRRYNSNFYPKQGNSTLWNNNNYLPYPLEHPAFQSKGLLHPIDTYSLSLNTKANSFNTDLSFLKTKPLAPGRCPSPMKQGEFNFESSYEKARTKVKNRMIRAKYQAQFERIMFRKKPHEIFRILAPRTDYENLDVSPDNKYGLQI